MQPARLRRLGTMAALTGALTVLALAGSSGAFALARRTAAAKPSTAAPSSSPSPSPSAKQQPYRVVGLGDSVPAGSACGCTTYVSLVARQAAALRGRAASVSNLAVPGLTTAGLAAQLRQAAVRRRLATADLVIVTIGANDFDPSALTAASCQPVTALSCYRAALATQRTLLSSVLAGIRTGTHTTVLVTGYWNVFLDGRVGRGRGSTYVRGSDALTRADNALIAAVAGAHGDTYVDVYTPFKGSGTNDDTALLAADGDHPNAAGHALIARTVLAALT